MTDPKQRTNTKRMHTVPASYLEPWGVTKARRSPAVWRYSRSSQTSIPIAIRNAAVWKDIYSFTDEAGRRNDEIEKMLAEVEGAYCQARADLVERSSLSIDQRIAMARFVGFQLMRTPRSLQLHRDEFAHHAKQEVLSLAADRPRFHSANGKDYESEEACEVARQGLLSGGWHFEADHFTGLHTMMNTVHYISLWVCLMRWSMLASDGDFKLLTSDNPVTAWAERHVAGQSGTEVGVGLDDPQLRLSVPITPVVSLVAEHTALSLLAVNADDIDDAQGKLRMWRPELYFRGATHDQLNMLNHATVTNASEYVFHCERDSRVERFLSKYFFNQPAPVRRRDRKPIGSPG